jgi:quercetin dioxygenase-like cupin family protein
MRKTERVQLPDQPGKGEVAFRFESLDYGAKERRFNSYLAEFFPVPAEKLRSHSHPGFEFIHALQGTLGVVMDDGNEYALAAGDSMYFDSSVPHAYRRNGGRTCSALVVTST